MNRREELYRALDQRMHEAENVRRKFGERSKEHAEAELAVLAARRAYDAMPKRINPHGLFIGAFVPNWMMEMKTISAGSKLCYAKLCQYAGKAGVAYPRIQTLSDSIKLSCRQVQRCLAELVREGLIQAEQSDPKAANRYYFLDHPAMRAGVTDVSPGGCQECHPGDDKYDTRVVTDMSPPINKERRESIEENQKKKFDPLTLHLPANLQTTAGRSAWTNWVTGRKESGKPLTPTAASLQIQKLAQCRDPIAVLERAAGNQWQGLNVRDEDLRTSTGRPPLHEGDRPY